MPGGTGAPGGGTAITLPQLGQATVCPAEESGLVIGDAHLGQL